MNEPAKIKSCKFYWQPAISAIALAFGIIGISEAPAQSLPESAKDSWQIAQVGVRRRATTPTPLNLRSKTHIPLPTNSRSSDYYRYRGYRHRYRRNDHYGYGHGHHHDCHHHDCGHHRRRGTTIIINPATSSYSNYSSQNGYIRIIRK